MFGIGNLFAAVKRLTGSVNAMADLFDQCNKELAERFSIADERPDTLVTNRIEDNLGNESLPSPVITKNGKSRIK